MRSYSQNAHGNKSDTTKLLICSALT